MTAKTLIERLALAFSGMSQFGGAEVGKALRGAFENGVYSMADGRMVSMADGRIGIDERRELLRTAAAECAAEFAAYWADQGVTADAVLLEVLPALEFPDPPVEST